LAAVSPQFEKLGDDLNTALLALRQGIQAEPRCWGGDKPGQQFEANYPQGDNAGGVGACLKSLQQLAGLVQSTGNNITATAGSLRAGDDRNATQVTRAGQSET
jgi:hypothetical protein